MDSDPRLAQFIPRYRRQALLAAFNSGEPSVSERLSAVLLLDIVGFTGLTDRLVQLSAGGAEHLAGIINDCLTAIAEAAERSGGVVATLAGDAVVVVWFADDEPSLDRAVMLACQAALAIQKEARGWAAGDDEPIRLRAAVASGRLRQFELGGRDGEWHGILSGPAHTAAAHAGALAYPGQTVLSDLAWRRVAHRCRASGNERGAIVLEQVTAPEAPPSMSHPGSLPSLVPVASVAPMVLDLMQTGELSGWNGEFRTATVVFSALKQPEHESAAAALLAGQEALSRVQATVSQYDGYLHQVRADEEGVTTISVFGLPPRSHEDDPIRAVQFALALHRQWSELGVTTSTGMATGRVFCALVKSGANESFITLVGPALNLAARLMQLNAGVVCDAETASTSRHNRRVLAHKLIRQNVKGKALPVEAYSPFGVGPPAQLNQRVRAAAHAAELGRLLAALHETMAGTPRTLLIEGEAGIGKTALLEALLEHAAGENLQCLLVRGDDGEHGVAYASLLPMFRALFGLGESFGSPDEEVAAIITALGPEARLAPVLREVLGITFTDSAETLALSGEVRAATTRRLLLDRLRAVATHSRVVLAVEDAHWLDSRSMTVLSDVIEARLPILLVITSRPVGDADSLAELVGALPPDDRMRLSGFDSDEVRRYLTAVFRVRDADADAVAAVRERAGGNPLFMSEIVPLMVEAGLLNVAGDALKLGPPSVAPHGRREPTIPRTLEEVVMARFDRLSGPEKLLLRAASVYARAFSATEIGAVAGSREIPGTDEMVTALAERGFLQPFGDDRFAFRHGVLKDVIYQSLAYSQRRRLHRAAAEAIIAAGPADSRHDAILGHHFFEAGEHERAALHLRAAALRALGEFANAEAASLSEAALSSLRSIPVQRRTGHARRDEAEIELVLGQSRHRLSHYDGAREHAEAGLRLLGFPVPRTAGGLGLAIARELTQQIAHRKLPFLVPRFSAGRRQNAVSAASALEYLVDIYYFSDDALRAGFAAFRMLNLAERARHADSKALGYVNLAGMAAAIGLGRVADRYRRRALDELPKVTDRHAGIWVPFLVGATIVGTGDWGRATKLLEEAKLAALAANDRRSWCAAVELCGVVDGCRGDWPNAERQASEMLTAAERDKDRRAAVAALRELAYYAIQQRAFAAAEERLARIGEEIERGLTAEVDATRMEVAAMRATLDYEGGRLDQAEQHATLALSLIERASLGFPMSYWTVFIASRTLLGLWQACDAGGPEAARFRRASRRACSALARQTRPYPIARPARHLAEGAFYRLARNEAKAHRHFALAKAEAERFGMRYEMALADIQLGTIASAGRPAPGGLPLFAGD